MAKKKNLKIGIMDADLLERRNHRFPNLVCEKISGFYKDKFKAEVTLLFDYESFAEYDEVFISKVFTNTPIPSWLIAFVDGAYPGDYYDAPKPSWMSSKKKPKIHLGGTGFYFDHAPELECEIEHHMPDYHLYDDWVESKIQKAKAEYLTAEKDFNEKQYKIQFKEYLDYSIGFVTRGCFRKCAFCVNQKYDHSFTASSLNEFYDPSRKKICLLDDNFLSFSGWEKILQEIIDTGKPYKFKQGLDERLLTDKKCEMLFSSNYDGDFTFAFDNIADYDLIHSKLKMIRKHNSSKGVMFYVLVGFESTGISDIENAFKRIALLMQYRCIPYIMRYMSPECAPWKASEYRSLYVSLARWCNQPSIFKKMSFRQFCEANQALHKTSGTLCSSMAAFEQLSKDAPEIIKKYCDMRFDDYK